MIHLCLICVSLRPGGTERIASRLVNHLSKSYKITVILLSSDTPFYEVAPSVSVVQFEGGKRKDSGFFWYPQVAKFLLKALSRLKPNLILCFGEDIAPLVIASSVLTRSKCVVFNRATPAYSLRGRVGFLNPLMYIFAKAIVVQTFRAAQVLERRYFLSKFKILPNPIEVPPEVPDLAARASYIVSVGTLGGRKNQAALIRAFASVPNRLGWKLVFVGDGPDRLDLEGLVRSLGLESAVQFLGRRADVQDILLQSKVFAFTSLREGFPNALAEALAAGCACISYDCPTGPSDLIDHGINGLLVPNGDEAAFRGSLERLMGDPVLQIRLAGAARQHIRKFESEVVLERFEALVRESLPESALKKVP